MLDFIRIATAVPPVAVGDAVKNAEDICRYIASADEAGCDVVVFPELALTGYTCADLFFQDILLTESMKGLQAIMECSKAHPGVTAAVGTPAVVEGQMYNCAAVISGGKLQGLVTKTHLPNYNEFSERRWFSSSEDLQTTVVTLRELGLEGEEEVPVGRDLLFKVGDGCMLGVEICEDLWTPLPPSTLLTINGAEVVLNLSASNEIAGKSKTRIKLVEHQSDVCACVYAYCSSGSTESVQDLVFSGHSIIAENGTVLADNGGRIVAEDMLITDADLGKVRAARRKNKSVRDAASFYGKVEPMRTIDCRSQALRSDGTHYPLQKYPFVPAEGQKEYCQSIFQIQVAGLKRRLQTVGAVPVLGLSGGLDSALAVLVAVAAAEKPQDVHALIMPGFGTSQRTYDNALKLAKALGVTVKEVDICPAVHQHFVDIGHDESVHNLVFENSQARERTQVLMDYAATVGGIVVGTGDLSELALGWCTYNGDQMSMYAVNGSIAKTLIRCMLENMAPEFADAKDILLDILATPVSAELLPGGLATEDVVGPYCLHDFFLYYMMRFAYAPSKIYTLACRAFAEEYDAETVKKWLRVFYTRFFNQQFKRNCLPDGVKVGNISLSPRGDWRMPSDASARIWLAEVERL